MGTPTNYYVDPLGGDDMTGDGSSGNPWMTVAHALGGTGITRDSTNGDQLNVRDTATETLSSLDIASGYGSPTADAPLIIRGYTSSANDGGVGILSGGGVGRIINTGADYVHLIDMRFTNSGSTQLINGDNNWTVDRCQFDDTSGTALALDDDATVVNCYFTNIGATGISTTNRLYVGSCTFENDGGSNSFTYGMTPGGTTGWNRVVDCIFKLSGSSNGLSHNGSGGHLEVRNCSFYSSSGTGKGVTGGAAARSIICTNNLAEGFSGVGGIGFYLRSWNAVRYGHNAAYNNTTNYNVSADIEFDLGDNESLSASPFTSSTDFTPVDTGNVLGGSYPTSMKGLPQATARDKGAVQKSSSGGGGGSRRSRIRRHN